MQKKQIIYTGLFHGGPKDGETVSLFNPCFQLTFSGSHIYKTKLEAPHHLRWIDDETIEIDFYYQDGVVTWMCKSVVAGMRYILAIPQKCCAKIV